MTRPKNRPETRESKGDEARLQEAIEGIKSGRFKSPYHALKEMPDVKRSTLYTRLNGTQPRNKAHEDQQHLSNAEERELAQWIRQMTHVNHAPSHPIVRYMAEFI
jgi:hypothetical protein